MAELLYELFLVIWCWGLENSLYWIYNFCPADDGSVLWIKTK
jgi:hypothetical protein